MSTGRRAGAAPTASSGSPSSLPPSPSPPSPSAIPLLPIPAKTWARKRKETSGAPKSPKKGIKIALIAAALAVAAIAFGYLREAKDRETEMQYLEQPADPQPATDTGAATPEQPITE